MSSVSIGELVAAGVLQIGDGYRTKRSEHAQEGYRIIRVADVMEDAVSLAGPDFVSTEYSKAIGTKAGQAGDILLTTKGTVGRVAVLPALDEPVVYSPQLCFFRVLDSASLVPRFLRYWFSSTEFWGQAADRMNNTDMAAYINLADIRSLRLTLPEPSEQQAITEVLGALDDKIAANTKLAVTAEGLINARWLKLVHGLVDFAEWRSIGSCGKVVTGKTPPTYISENYGGETPFVTVGDMRNGLYVSSTDRTLSKQGVAAVRGALLPAGAVLMSCIATVGEVAVTSVPSVTNQQINALIPDNELDPMFTSYSFRTLGAELKGMGSGGSVYTNVSKAKFSSLRIPVPPYEAQVRVVSELDRVSSSARTEVALITATRDALLPQLMSGKLRVKDAERVLEDAGV